MLLTYRACLRAGRRARQGSSCGESRGEDRGGRAHQRLHRENAGEVTGGRGSVRRARPPGRSRARIPVPRETGGQRRCQAAGRHLPTPTPRPPPPPAAAGTPQAPATGPARTCCAPGPTPAGRGGPRAGAAAAPAEAGRPPGHPAAAAAGKAGLAGGDAGGGEHNAPRQQRQRPAPFSNDARWRRRSVMTSPPPHQSPRPHGARAPSRLFPRDRREPVPSPRAAGALVPAGAGEERGGGGPGFPGVPCGGRGPSESPASRRSRIHVGLA